MEFQTKDICRICEIKVNQAQYWTRLGIIEADITGATTQGKARLFSFKNLIEFAVARELFQGGLEVKMVRPALLASRANHKAFWETPTAPIDNVDVQPIILLFGNAVTATTFKKLEELGLTSIDFPAEYPPPREILFAHGLGSVMKQASRYLPLVKLINLETVKRQVLGKM